MCGLAELLASDSIVPLSVQGAQGAGCTLVTDLLTEQTGNIAFLI